MTGEPPRDATAEIERFASPSPGYAMAFWRWVVVNGEEGCRHDDPMTLVTAADGCSLQCERCGQIVVPVEPAAIDALEAALARARKATDSRGLEVILPVFSARAAGECLAELAEGFRGGRVFSAENPGALAAIRNMRLLLDVIEAYIAVEGRGRK